MSTLDARLARLGTLSPAELRAEWVAFAGAPAPRLSPSLLRLALGWELQAKATGGLTRETRRTLDQLGAGKTRTEPARPGLRLAREWGGVTHVVVVGEDRVIRWNGRDWRSLSEVARAITGTRWSGPAFFGLKTKAAAR